MQIKEEVDLNRYYTFLGLEPGASEEELIKVYKKKAKLFHPDSNKQSNHGDAMMKELNVAKERVLEDIRKSGKEYRRRKSSSSSYSSSFQHSGSGSDSWRAAGAQNERKRSWNEDEYIYTEKGTSNRPRYTGAPIGVIVYRFVKVAIASIFFALYYMLRRKPWL